MSKNRLNRKKYHGFISKSFCFLAAKTNVTDEYEDAIESHIHVRMEWSPKGYSITEAEVIHKRGCYLEDYPFRRSEKDLTKIANLRPDLK